MHDDMTRVIIIPTLASLITGLLCGLLLLAVGTWQAWPVIFAAIGGLASGLLSWFAWSSRFARVLEAQLMPVDLSPIGYIEEPEPDNGPIRIEVINPGTNGQFIEGQFLDLPTDQARLRLLASGLTKGAPLSVHNWTGSKAVFTRHEFETIRIELERRGLAENLGGNIGYRLTAAGRGVMKKLAGSTTPPAEMDQL